VDGQRVGVAQQILESGGAADAERQLGAVGQVRIVKHDPKPKGAHPQRHRGTDPPEPDDAEGLHREAADQLAFDRSQRRRRVPPLPLVIEDHATAQRQCQHHRMVGDLGGAVVGDIADEDITRGRGRPRDLVVADAPYAR
jgi:hypothetical protein